MRIALVRRRRARGPLHAVVGVIVLLTSAPASAGPTGLAVIPTTDLVRFHQVNAVLQNGNTTIDGRHPFFHDVEPVPQLEVGLPWDLEAGVDGAPAHPPGECRPFFNLKWTMVAEDYRVPAVAVGATQLGPGVTPAGFVVASKTLNYDEVAYQKFRAHHRNLRLHGMRAHAGFLQVGALPHAMLGCDVELSEHFVLWADWISGAKNALSLAGVVVFDHQNSLFVALLRENDENRVSGILFNFTHTFDW
ncbi:MAG: hypothetical protein HY271_05035 [Deltaproteobacteria bacterium]|nr:hypothetical protein [Deltaproteobacteria bacterium]